MRITHLLRASDLRSLAPSWRCYLCLCEAGHDTFLFLCCNSDESSFSGQCTLENGWFTAKALESMKRQVKQRFKKLLQAGADGAPPPSDGEDDATGAAECACSQDICRIS